MTRFSPTPLSLRQALAEDVLINVVVGSAMSVNLNTAVMDLLNCEQSWVVTRHPVVRRELETRAAVAADFIAACSRFNELAHGVH